SIINTKKDNIEKINNIVIDPKGINYNHFFEIIDAIYDEDADAYVVYNKNYENSRLKEMSKIFQQHEWVEQNYKFSMKVREYNSKIREIIEKTIDLLELFKVTSINGDLPPIFLWELYGFSSIKTIEKYITKKGYELKVMIEPYSELDVKNGLMAMSKAIDRNLGGIGNKEWLETQEQLKKYCENDVKAMLMVYHFATKILKDM
ncbi:MAG: UU173 family protein, partial [Metamycoplasmataceae bacterium]